MTNIVPRINELKGADPETAFLDAQREARHLYGHHGATGTIADADGHIVVQGPALLPWDGRRAAQQLLRDGHAKPGGPAFILTLTDPKRTRTVRVPVDVTNLTPGQADDAIDTAVRAKLPDNYGIAAIELRDSDAEGDERKGTLKTKTILTTGKGKKVTRYSVRADATGNELAAFDTLPEAKAWMKDALDKASGPMHCIAETRKETGPLLEGRCDVLKQTVIAVATIGTTIPTGNGTYLAAGIFNTP